MNDGCGGGREEEEEEKNSGATTHSRNEGTGDWPAIIIGAVNFPANVKSRPSRRRIMAASGRVLCTYFARNSSVSAWDKT